MEKILFNTKDDNLIHVIAHAQKVIVSGKNFKTSEIRNEIVGIELIAQDENNKTVIVHLHPEVFELIFKEHELHNWKKIEVTEKEFDDIIKEEENNTISDNPNF